ncbi:MAG: T9SS type A sorting domain-containing protein [Candidatus Cloacimonetes bacterium]|nr:T9SS type A sorting domain-containing protein [Candidatus Cloacimonadota bacterium]MDY0173272.1 T9SS type A sorting domain-containing protein [Candidatus Cloacimonadaceae bacterium]
MKRQNLMSIALMIAALIFLVPAFAGPINVNMLANPGAESGATDWTFVNGGNGWTYDGLIYSSPPGYILPRTGNGCFNSSYEICTKSQTVDLISQGFTVAELDAGDLSCAWHEWLYQNEYCSGLYFISVNYLNAAGLILSSDQIGSEQSVRAANNQVPDNTIFPIPYLEKNTPWTQFNGGRALPFGTRKIQFTSGGKDGRWWAGHHGPSFDDASLVLTSSPTLPVTLSSFTAVLSADLNVNIAWTAESETNHAGYNVLRSEVKELSTAMMINNALIDAGSVEGTQINYQYTDTEVYRSARYYYWLEDRSLTGESRYHGPLMVTISAQGDEPGIPSIPVETKLFSAFPNPFNPSTNLRYSMKEAGAVRIEVYNVKGQILASFNNTHNQAGYYQINWDGRDMSGNLAGTGVYFYRMSSDNYTSTQKMVLAK